MTLSLLTKNGNCVIKTFRPLTFPRRTKQRKTFSCLDYFIQVQSFVTTQTLSLEFKIVIVRHGAISVSLDWAFSCNHQSFNRHRSSLFLQIWQVPSMASTSTILISLPLFISLVSCLTLIRSTEVSSCFVAFTNYINTGTSSQYLYLFTTMLKIIAFFNIIVGTELNTTTTTKTIILHAKKKIIQFQVYSVTSIAGNCYLQMEGKYDHSPCYRHKTHLHLFVMFSYFRSFYSLTSRHKNVE